jgi:hypothetical protein
MISNTFAPRMAHTPKPLSPKDLAELLAELDQVMEEASTLRREVTRQLDEQRQRQQQHLSPAARKPANQRR